MKRLCILLLIIGSFILVNCSLLAYDGMVIPPQQIPQMRHLYTQEVPSELLKQIFNIEKVTLSGASDDLQVLFLVNTDSGRKFLLLSQVNVSLLLDGTGDGYNVMRSAIGFSVPAGDTASHSLFDISNDGISISQGDLVLMSFGTNNLPSGQIPDMRIPLYDPQVQQYTVVGFNDNDLGSAIYNGIGFNSTVTHPQVIQTLNNSFSLLNNNNYTATSFWNFKIFSFKQTEMLVNSNMLLLHVSKHSSNIKEEYIFLFNTNTSELSGPKRVLVSLPAVLFRDTVGTIWVLQAVNKDKTCTIFHLLDNHLAIRKRLIVYGNTVYPLGIQTINGEQGLTFCVVSRRWNSPSMFFSLFFLPLSKLGEL